MKNRKVILTSGIVLLTTVMLTGCGKVNVKIYNKEKESEFKANNVVVNEATNEVVNKQVQNTVKDKINNEEERENNTTIEYTGEIATVDLNEKNPSFANSKYIAYVQDTGDKKISSIDVEVTYKIRGPVKIHIDDITLEGEEAAAGTIIEHFSFRGTTEDGYTLTGKGTLYYSSVVDNNTIGLEMEYDEDLFDGVNISTNKKINLGSQENIVNEP